MKGANPGVIGVLMILLVAIVFIMDKVIVQNKNISIASSAAELFETQGAAESLKRSLDSYAVVSVWKTLPDLANGGGGFSTWSDLSPNSADLKNKFEEKLKNEISTFSYGKIGNKNVGWGLASVSVGETSGGLAVSGEKNFIVSNSGFNPNVSIEVAGKFSREINNDYIKVLATGRSLFEGGWKVSESVLNKAGSDCKIFSSGQRLEGGEFTISTKNMTGNALLCGYRNLDGVKILSTYSKQDFEKTVSDIESSIATDLSSGFQTTLSPQFFAEEDGDNMKITVTTNVTVLGKKKIPTTNSPVSLNFLVRNVFELPKGSETAPPK